MALGVTFREYDVDAGTIVRNMTEMDFGTLVPGRQSDVKAFDVAVTGVASVSNVRMVVADPGEIPVPRYSSGSVTASSGLLGMETSSSLVRKASLGTFFAGYGAEVPVALRSSGITDYIYLSVNPGNTPGAKGELTYRLKFDFVDAIPSLSSSSSISSCSSSSSNPVSSSSCSLSSSSSISWDGSACSFISEGSGSDDFYSESVDCGDEEYHDIEFTVSSGQARMRISKGATALYDSGCVGAGTYSDRIYVATGGVILVEVFSDCQDSGAHTSWSYGLQCLGYSSSSSSWSSNSGGFSGGACITEIPEYPDPLKPARVCPAGRCEATIVYETFFVKDRLLVVGQGGDGDEYEDCDGNSATGTILYDSGCVGTSREPPEGAGGPVTDTIVVRLTDLPLTVVLEPRCSGAVSSTRWWLSITGCGIDFFEEGGNSGGCWDDVDSDNVNDNAAPVAVAGTDQTVLYSGGQAIANLAGSVADDGLPGPDAVVSKWQNWADSDKGNVAFGDAELPVTTATFTDVNFASTVDFPLRLRAYDTIYFDEDEVVITVSSSSSSSTSGSSSLSSSSCFSSSESPSLSSSSSLSSDSTSMSSSSSESTSLSSSGSESTSLSSSSSESTSLSSSSTSSSSESTSLSSSSSFSSDSTSLTSSSSSVSSSQQGADCCGTYLGLFAVGASDQCVCGDESTVSQGFASEQNAKDACASFCPAECIDTSCCGEYYVTGPDFLGTYALHCCCASSSSSSNSTSLSSSSVGGTSSSSSNSSEDSVVTSCTYPGCDGCISVSGTYAGTYDQCVQAAEGNCPTECSALAGCGDWCGTYIISYDEGTGDCEYTCCCQT